ncbi:MAG: UDP-phosphate alpha N-acetylglucosaminyltransferase [Pseudomonadota bacterium]
MQTASANIGGPAFDTSLVGAVPTSTHTPRPSVSGDELDTVPSWRATGTMAVITGTLTFNTLLASMTALGLPVNAGMVILCEMILLSAALGLGLNARLALPVIVAVFVSYMFFLMMLRPGIDLKAVRDILVPIAFYFVGRNLRDIAIMDRFVIGVGAFIVCFGFFEWAAVDLYVQYVGPLEYYIARGTVEAGDVSDYVRETGLFASGTRYGDRNLFPGLVGDHRVSSVFLEPVSMGNFGAILFMWGAFRSGMKNRWMVFALAALCIIGSDARFGLMASVAVGAALLIARFTPRIALFVLPFAILAGLFAYGQTSIAILWDDNFSGRILWAAQIIDSLSWKHVLGISYIELFVADSGYAYVLTQIGIVGMVFVWALFVYTKGPNLDAWRFRFAFGVYLCLNLLVSNSAFSIKTGAILWAMLGVADCAQRVRSSYRRRDSKPRSMGSPVAFDDGLVVEPALASQRI